MADYESNEEKTFLTIASLGAIVGIVLPLIMWALKKDSFSEYTKNFLASVVNFELVMLIICIGIGLIPFARNIVSLVIFIFNLIVALKAFSAVQEKKEYAFPINVQIIK